MKVETQILHHFSDDSKESTQQTNKNSNWQKSFRTIYLISINYSCHLWRIRCWFSHFIVGCMHHHHHHFCTHKIEWKIQNFVYMWWIIKINLVTQHVLMEEMSSFISNLYATVFVIPTQSFYICIESKSIYVFVFVLCVFV